jgi:arsenate reductase
MATALFVCRQNAGRSQMSAALFEQAAEGRHQALSAGTTPAERVHPEVVEVMRELDIDLADRVPRALTRELAERADVVVTMGCGDECPYIPGKRYRLGPPRPGRPPPRRSACHPRRHRPQGAEPGLRTRPVTPRSLPQRTRRSDPADARLP